MDIANTDFNTSHSTCNTEFICEYENVHEHSYTANITKQPTCTSTGEKTFACSCGASYTESISVTGHVYETVVTAPSCTEKGYSTHTCKTCGDSYTDSTTDTIPETSEEIPENPKGKKVIRLAGSTRYETGYKVADVLKEILGVEQFDSVIVATGKNFADALAGRYLAVQKNAPIILTNGKDDNVAQLHEYIKANVSANGTVYILGGEAVVPKSVEAITGYNVKRLAGNSRYDTNLEILIEAGITGDEIIVATGKFFADSLSASAAKLPILLVKPNGTLNVAQKAILRNMNKTYIVGGEGVVSKGYETELMAYGTVERVFGATRYDTSVEIAREFSSNVDSMVVASGKNFPDGLCGGPLAAALNVPLILTKDNGVDAAMEYAGDNAITGGYVLGGVVALTDETVVNVFKLESEQEIK